MTDASNLVDKRCKACKGGMPPMVKEQSQEYLAKVLGWELVEGTKIKKEFKFKKFLDSIAFVNKIADIAEAEGHHPTITIIYNKVKITLSTHAIGGLSENDFIIAAKIDRLI
ncbi:4a-hydroxytetrahydrobiopterin dehydratase [Candidatus Omnitrophota bacterium]